MNRLPIRRSRAFTLVELLVVIAIVTLLITILIPTLTQVRETTYITLCGGNLRQSGVGITAYAYDYKECIPPACSRNDTEVIPAGVTGAGDNCGPAELVSNGSGSPQFILGTSSNHGNLARIDSYADYSYSSGPVLMWAAGYLPFDLGGARALWCPGERKSQFLVEVAGYWTTKSAHPAGSATYGIIDHPFASIQYSTGNAANWTVVTSYGYRSIGFEPQTTNDLSKCITKGSWHISDLAKYCAEVDYCANILSVDNIGRPTTPTFSHGQTTNQYMGANRLFYDGHAKWLSDPNATYNSYVGGGQYRAIANTSRESAWINVYDVNP